LAHGCTRARFIGRRDGGRTLVGPQKRASNRLSVRTKRAQPDRHWRAGETEEAGVRPEGMFLVATRWRHSKYRRNDRKFALK